MRRQRYELSAATLRHVSPRHAASAVDACCLRLFHYVYTERDAYAATLISERHMLALYAAASDERRCHAACWCRHVGIADDERHASA